jgi:hypothetical protein
LLLTFVVGVIADFFVINALLIWYDSLYVLDLLTQFPWLRKDSRLIEMAEIMKSKMNERGHFKPESIWMAWKGWDFVQKKEPSRWLTFLVFRIFKRLNIDR